MEEIGKLTLVHNGQLIVQYVIPDKLSNPICGTLNIPNIPILIQVLTVCDYASALKLLQMSAGVNIKSSEISKMAGNKPANSTPLMTLTGTITESCEKEGQGILQLMLEKKARVNDQDAMGFTALHLLVNNNNISVNTKLVWIDILLKHGANKSIEMPIYGTPKSLAKLIELDIKQPEVYAKL